MFERLIIFFLFILLLPFNLVILLISKYLDKFINLKIYKIHIEKIGHFIFDTLLFYERKNKKLYNEDSKINLIIPYIDAKQKKSNTYLLKFWKKFQFIDHSGLVKFLNLTNEKFLINKNLNLNIRPYDYDETLKNNILKVKFNNEELEKGNKFFNKIGIKKNDKFVCLLLRDSKYLKEKYPERDYSYHDYRNVSLNSYVKTCKYLSSKNIKVVRMGKNVSEKLIIEDKNVIDYASSEYRNDFLDIFISAHCYFWISSGSGLDSLNYLFKKPILYTNRAPIGYIMSNKYSFSITKHYYDLNDKKRLSLNEIYQKSLHLNINSDILKNKGVELIDNTSEEILEATKEFYNYVEGKFDYENERNILNNQIKNTIKYDEKEFLDINDKPIKNFKNHPNLCYSFLIKNKYLLN